MNTLSVSWVSQSEAVRCKPQIIQLWIRTFNSPSNKTEQLFSNLCLFLFFFLNPPPSVGAEHPDHETELRIRLSDRLWTLWSWFSRHVWVVTLIHHVGFYSLRLKGKQPGGLMLHKYIKVIKNGTSCVWSISCFMLQWRKTHFLYQQTKKSDGTFFMFLVKSELVSVLWGWDTCSVLLWPLNK